VKLTREQVQRRFLSVFEEVLSWPLFSRADDLPSPFLRVAPALGSRLLESESFRDFQLELQNRQSAALFNHMLEAVGPRHVVELRKAGVPPSNVKERFDREIARAWARCRAAEAGERVSLDCVRHTLVMLAQERGFGFALSKEDSFELLGSACRAGYVPGAIVAAVRRTYPGRDLPELDVESWVAY
jgi:hypothetical protein